MWGFFFQLGEGDSFLGVCVWGGGAGGFPMGGIGFDKDRGFENNLWETLLKVSFQGQGNACKYKNPNKIISVKA